MTTVRFASAPATPLPARSPAEVQASAHAAQAYEAMNGGATGWGTDHTALFDVLERGDLGAVRAEYQQHYRRSFDDDVRGELSGLDRTRADALLRGDRGLADATRLHQAMKGGTGAGTDETSLFATLEGKDAAQRTALQAAYRDRYGDLAGALASELGTHSDDAIRARALLSGDRALADAAKLHQAMKGNTGAGTDEATVLDTLDGAGAPERRALIAAYGKQYGAGSSDPALRRDVSSELGGATRDRALALIDGDRAGADAAKVRDAMKGGWTGIGTDTRAIQDTFEGKGTEDRRAVIDAYNKKYGGAPRSGLAQDLDRELGVNDRAKTQALIDRGQLTDAEKVHFAMAGAGTDEVALLDALRGKSSAQVSELSAQYRRDHGRELSTAIAGEVGGRTAFDARQLQKGRPETAEAALSRIEEARTFERSGWVNGASRAVMDVVAPEKGRTLDRNAERARALVRDAAVEERPMTAREKAEMSRLSGWVDHDVASYRGAKDSAAETAGTAAATLATTGVVLASGGTATPGVLALAGAAGGGANVAAKATIGGAGYGSGDALSDGVLGAADGMLGVTGPGSAVARRVVQSQARSALAKGGVREASAEVVELAGHDMMRRSMERRMLVGGLATGVDGAVGGAAMGGGAMALRDGTWDQGASAGLAQVAAGAAGGATVGAGIGFGPGSFSGISGRRLPGVDEARIAQRHQRGDNHWRTVGDPGDMIVVTRGLDRAPKTLPMTSASGDPVQVFGARSPREVEMIQGALERMRSVGGDRALPSEVHVRGDLGAMTDAAGSDVEPVGGLAGDGRNIIVRRGALASPEDALTVLAHEAGHNVDADGRLSSGKGAALFGKGESVAPYAATNPREDFAETHRALIEHWDEYTGDPARHIDNGSDVGKKYRFILDHVYGDEAPPRTTARAGGAMSPAPLGPRDPAPVRPWPELSAMESELGGVRTQLDSATQRLEQQRARLTELEGAYTGPKPAYLNPGHHDPKSAAFRAGGSMTTALPADAAEVYARALPEPGQKGRIWWGQATQPSRDGKYDWYRFSGDERGVHWSGASGLTGSSAAGSSDRSRRILEGNVPGDVKRRAALPADLAQTEATVSRLAARQSELTFALDFANLEMADARQAALTRLGTVDPAVAAMGWTQLNNVARSGPDAAQRAEAQRLIAAMLAE